MTELRAIQPVIQAGVHKISYSRTAVASLFLKKKSGKVKTMEYGVSASFKHVFKHVKRFGHPEAFPRRFQAFLRGPFPSLAGNVFLFLPIPASRGMRECGMD